MEGCLACGQDLHEECLDLDEVNGETVCCCEEGYAKTAKLSFIQEEKIEKEVGISAGRKRAAVEYKIYPDKDCEWRFKANCGGGKYPIIGCRRGVQQNRHHGPVKDTTRNEPKNVHLICARCHNEWHAKNDPVYNKEEFELLPHDPRMMTPADMFE